MRRSRSASRTGRFWVLVSGARQSSYESESVALDIARNLALHQPGLAIEVWDHAARRTLRTITISAAQLVCEAPRRPPV